MEDFKKGDVVSHKTKKDLKMTIIDNCVYEKPTVRQIGKKDPNHFSCRFYNEKTDSWEVGCFYSEELILVSE
jgi:hypothetical protein